MKIRKVKPNGYYKYVWDIPIDIILDYKIVCFDLDNTLDPPLHETTSPLPEVVNYLNGLKKSNVEILIISNNTIMGRCESFCDFFEINYISGARKPFLKNINKSEILSRYSKGDIIFIGDKLVTDILCSKWYGVDSILVDQLSKNNKKWYSIFMGFSEQVFCFINGFKKGDYFEKM